MDLSTFANELFSKHIFYLNVPFVSSLLFIVIYEEAPVMAEIKFFHIMS